jgi:hypothetical protein
MRRQIAEYLDRRQIVVYLPQAVAHASDVLDRRHPHNHYLYRFRFRVSVLGFRV